MEERCSWGTLYEGSGVGESTTRAPNLGRIAWQLPSLSTSNLQELSQNFGSMAPPIRVRTCQSPASPTSPFFPPATTHLDMDPKTATITITISVPIRTTAAILKDRVRAAQPLAQRAFPSEDAESYRV